MVLVARQPGALNLEEDDLSLLDIISVTTGGPVQTQTTLGDVKALFGLGPTIGGYRLVTSGAVVDMDSEDVGILLRKTVSSATQVNLPLVPPDGMEVFVKYGKDDQESNNTTISAGGVLINGLTSLVMVAAWQVVHLKFMDEQWWTV